MNETEPGLDPEYDVSSNTDIHTPWAAAAAAAAAEHSSCMNRPGAMRDSTLQPSSGRQRKVIASSFSLPLGGEGRVGPPVDHYPTSHGLTLCILLSGLG